MSENVCQKHHTTVLEMLQAQPRMRWCLRAYVVFGGVLSNCSEKIREFEHVSKQLYTVNIQPQSTRAAPTGHTTLSIYAMLCWGEGWLSTAFRGARTTDSPNPVRNTLLIAQTFCSIFDNMGEVNVCNYCGICWFRERCTISIINAGNKFVTETKTKLQRSIILNLPSNSRFRVAWHTS